MPKKNQIKNLKQNIKNWLPIVVLCSSLAFTSAMHKYYVSMTNIEISRDAKKINCSISMFKDDLELALTEHTGEKVLFHIGMADSLLSAKTDAYLQLHFNLKEGESNLNRKFLGAEVEIDKIWVYIEYDAPKVGFQLKNTCLMELFDNQVNLVHFNNGHDIKSELLRLSNNEAQFTLK